MDRLVSMHHEHTAQKIPVELEAAWLHHRFTQIHPFQDGNGRVARTLATLVFLREAWFPLIVDRKQRAEYIEALEAADAGDLEPLVKLFAQSQTQGLMMAVSIADDTLRPERRLQSEIEAIRGRLQQRQQQNLAFMERVFGVGAVLQESVLNRFSSIAFELNSVFSELNTGAEAQAQSSTTHHDYWYQGDVLEIAKGLGYVANTREYRAWQRIRVRESNSEQFEMVVHFHSVGFDFVGILGASAFAVVRTGRETARVMLGERGFQFACTESQERISKRFSEWFEEAVLVGLETYRRHL
jgi:hypothetical protein